MMYESLEADYRHLLERVQLWDVAGERQVEIRGRDALALVELMTPRDIGRCAIGQCKYAPVVDEHGGIVNDPLILRLAEDHFWVSVADSDVLLWAKGIAAGRGFDVHVDEPDVSPLALQGPFADDVAEAVFGTWTRSLRFFRFRETEIDGIPVVVARSGWSKQGGFEIYLRDGSRGGALWDRIRDAGEPYGIRPGSPNLIERIESRLISYGTDVTLEHDPFEAGLEAYCDLDKPAGVPRARRPRGAAGKAAGSTAGESRHCRRTDRAEHRLPAAARRRLRRRTRPERGVLATAREQRRPRDGRDGSRAGCAPGDPRGWLGAWRGGRGRGLERGRRFAYRCLDP